MKNIYQVKIHGRTLESCDLRVLLARAVMEKRNMDRRIQLLLGRPVSKMISLRPDFQHLAG
jgi:hypothetical protein